MKKRLAILASVSTLCLCWSAAQATPQSVISGHPFVSSNTMAVAAKSDEGDHANGYAPHKARHHAYRHRSDRDRQVREGYREDRGYGYDNDASPIDNLFALVPFAGDDGYADESYRNRRGYARSRYNADDDDGVFLDIF